MIAYDKVLMRQTRRITMKYTKLQGQQAYWQVPPNYIGQLCGAKYAFQTRDGHITVTYLDDTTETREAGNPDIDSFPTFFAIVSHVQATRAK